MSEPENNEKLKKLQNAGRGVVSANLKKLVKLVESELTLQPFLEQVLPTAVELFRAQGGMIWLRPHGANGAWFALRHKMEQVSMGASESKKHERLVQFAWQQRQPMLIEPNTRRKGQPVNPTDFSLLFGPVVHWSEPVALIELLLDPGLAPITPEQRKLYLRSVQVIVDQLHTGLRRRMNLPAATIAQAELQVNQLREEINSYEMSIRRSIEARLRQFHGWTFGSLQENQQFAKMVHELLDAHGLRARCPECGNAAILRCLKAGNAKNGVFVFDHYLEDGRTFHGGPTTVPMLTVISKPLRRPNLAAS